MQFFELVAAFGGIRGGLYRINTLLKLQDLGDTLSFDILHGHVEAAVHLPAVINLQEPRVGLVELLLEQGAAAFGPQHDLRPRVWGFFDDLQDGVAVIVRVNRQVDICHTSAELRDDLVSAEMRDVQHDRGPNVPASRSSACLKIPKTLGATPAFPRAPRFRWGKPVSNYDVA